VGRLVFSASQPDVPDAQISAANEGSHIGRLTHVAMPTGPNTIVITAPLRKTVSQIEGIYVAAHFHLPYQDR
jgi:hypothetical protein